MSMPTKADGLIVLFVFDDEGEGPGAERFGIDGSGKEVIEGVDVVADVFYDLCFWFEGPCMPSSLTAPVSVIPAPKVNCFPIQTSLGPIPYR